MKLKMLLGFIVAVLIGWEFHAGDSFKFPPPASPRSGSAIRAHAFQPLFENAKPLSELARDGVYTVVEVYINTCATCKQIEAQLPAFVAYRNDVVIRRVHFPEEGIGWNGEQYDAMAARGLSHLWHAARRDLRARSQAAVARSLRRQGRPQLSARLDGGGERARMRQQRSTA